MNIQPVEIPNVVPSPAAREYVLAGDEHAGVELRQASASWFGEPGGAFVLRRRVEGHGFVVAALVLDDEGYGTVVVQLTGDDALPAEIREIVAPCTRCVVATEEGDAMLPEGPRVAARVPLDEVARFESHVLGLERARSDRDAAAWPEVRACSRSARRRVSVAATADLLALVAMGGRRHPLH